MLSMEVEVPSWSSLVRTAQYTLEVNRETRVKWQKMGKERNSNYIFNSSHRY